MLYIYERHEYLSVQGQIPAAAGMSIWVSTDKFLPRLLCFPLR
jgi:hypothetical protein